MHGTGKRLGSVVFARAWKGGISGRIAIGGMYLVMHVHPEINDCRSLPFFWVLFPFMPPFSSSSLTPLLIISGDSSRTLFIFSCALPRKESCQTGCLCYSEWQLLSRDAFPRAFLCLFGVGAAVSATWSVVACLFQVIPVHCIAAFCVFYFSFFLFIECTATNP